MGPTALDKLQREVLAAFFALERGFFLTGGAALAGFHLGHRRTQDLDLFTTEDRLEEGVSALRAAALEAGAVVEAVRSSPDFRRFLLRRGEESVVVDLVRDPTPQLFSEKPLFGNIRVDPPAEIMANKICTLLSRAEIRDLVDVWSLEKAGLSVEETLPAAAMKDGGLTPGQLAWVLSQIRIGDDAVIPGAPSVEELRRYLQELAERLTRLAYPS
ncbi:MAG: nucleotidyl transferase AbiEii/AbiGii toxin family protein [Acidobacteriota bacterium]|nr:nucleotidyl transferase AbiEii/AbiGii toxin family protein [Acidobacteriota bacterium]